MKNNNPQEAIILCGGKGTRLQAVVKDVPKPLALVSGKPFLEHLIGQLSGWKINHALLSIGYLADKIEAHFGDHCLGLDITYVREDTPLGTGGAMALASKSLSSAIDTKPVIVINGDSYCQVDFAAASLCHAERGLPVTLVLVEVADVSRYGAIKINGNGTIKSFEEKGDRPGPGLINAGIYFIDPDLLRAIPQGREISFERDVLPGWVDGGINCYVSSGTFIDIGTPESFALAQSVFSDND